jgi:hypothetical protein
VRADDDKNAGGDNDRRRLNPVVADVLSYDTFEDGTFGNYASASSRGTVVAKGSTVACQGSRSVLITQLSYFRHKAVYNVTTYNNFRLSFEFRALNLEGTDAFTVSYTQDNATVSETLIRWTEVKRFQLGTDFTTQNSCIVPATFLFFTVPTSINQIRLRFKAEAGKGDNFYIDDILFEGIRAPTTLSPTQLPTGAPTLFPTKSPSLRPTLGPTSLPTNFPTLTPTSLPTNVPTLTPTLLPTNVPTLTPTSQPTKFWDRSEICPLNKTYPATKYMIQEYTGPVVISNVEDDVSEISGMVFTTLTDTSGSRYAYVASDKNQFSLKVIKFNNDGTARTVAVYSLTNIDFSNGDWEDLSLGPCSDGGGTGIVETCIYIGNFGNNNRGGTYVQRTELEIYKFKEPAFTGVNPIPVNRTIKPAIITYNYGNFFQSTDEGKTERFDAEAMFVDWTGAQGVGMGDIYVVLKGGCEGVGRIAVSLHQSLNLDPLLDHNPVSSNKRVNVGAMEKVMADDPVQGTSRGTLTCHDPNFRVWTGADMSRNGRLIAMIVAASPPRVYFFPRETGQTVVDALSVVGCDFVSATPFGLLNEKQHEAVAFVNAEGTIFAETSECNSGSPCKVPTYMQNLVFQDDSPTGSVELACGWNTITYDDFEGISNLGATYTTLPLNVSDPDAVLSITNSCRNSQSIKLRWHNGISSSIFHNSNRDCSSYSYLRITFQFRLVDYDHMDALFLELSLDGGVVYSTINSWAFGIDDIIANGVCYRRTVVAFAGDFTRQTFGTQVRLRFRTSANNKAESAFIDDIRFEGHSGTPILCI